MKILLIVASVVMLVAQITARQADASEGFEDLVKVVKSGANDEALTAYIDASPVAYALTVDEILYLNDLGVSTDMIKAVVEHGKKLAAGVSVGSQPVVEVEGTAPQPAPALNEIQSSTAQAEASPPPPEPPLQVAGNAPLPDVSVPPPQDVVEENGAGAGENVESAVPPVQEVVQEPVLDAPDVTAPPPDAVDVSSFYDALSPYGSWLNVDGTWYWQPTVMVTDSGWSPYCQGGYWVYTDCGWLWQSTYSWGWAPFHYGRWNLDPRYGWIWQPDTVWGPAWVSWRQSDEAIGWAPLPSEARYEAGVGFSFHGQRVSADFSFGMESRQFTFVPAKSFGERELVRFRLPRTEVTRIYNTTTAIQNNYTYNHRIIDRGPSIARIQKVTHQAIKQLRIVNQQIEAGHPIRSGTISGESVAVYAPRVVSTTHETPQAVIARRQASAQTRQVEARKSSVFGTYERASVVQSEQERGIISRQASHLSVAPRTTVPTVVNKAHVSETDAGRRQIDEAAVARQRQEQQRAEAAAAQQRQAEEAAANLRERERQRAAEVAQKQAEQRQHDQEIERQRAAAEQQHRAEEFAQKQAEQQRAQEYARQQAEQQRAQDLARQRDEQQRAEIARRQQQQLQAQRQAEEAAARQQEEQRVQQQRQQEQQQQQRQEQQRQQEQQQQQRQEQQRQQEQQQQQRQEQQRQQEQQQQRQEQQQQQAAQQRAQQSAFQGYGNGSMASAASNRGSASRVGVTNPRKR
ncbi:MAG: DUF6600 domain-containing protein [Verrucomicrobiia bacterium]|jgi:hypothetical protein